MTLTKKQREALSFLNEVNVLIGEWCGHVSWETYRDRFGPPIHWRTAESLASKGLVRLGPKHGPGDWEQDIFLTTLGASLKEEKL